MVIHSFTDTNNWHLVTMTVSGTKGILYLDGSAVKTGTMSDAGWSDPCRIGTFGVSSYPYKGSIYKPQIWNRALTSTEAWQLYTDVKNNYQGLFDGLVCGLDFKGDAKDFSGNGNDGTVTGATLTTDQFGIVDSAYSFDGGDYIMCGNDASVQITGTAITLSAYIYKTGTGHGYIISKGRDYTTNRGYHLDSYDDSGSLLIRARYRLTNDTNNLPFVTGLSYNTWYHVVSTFDGATGKIYIDGVLMGTDSTAGSIGSASTTLQIGVHYNTWYKFVGKIISPLIFNRVLSDDEVKTLNDLSKKGLLHPYKKNTNGGITQ